MTTDSAIDFEAQVDKQSTSASAVLDKNNPFVAAWKARTIVDARKPRPSLLWLVDRLFPVGSLSIVFGAPGSLKSMILADMCACVVSGRPWLEPLPGKQFDDGPFLTTQSPALWLDFDNGTRRTDERIEAFANAYSLPDDAPFHYLSMPTPWLNLSKLEVVMQIAYYIKQGGYRLLVIDNLGLVKGDVEENSAEMAMVMGHIRWLVEECQIAAVLIHHQRKSSTNGDSGGIRKGETLRGHSSIEAACDLVLHVGRGDGEDFVTLMPTKVRGAMPFTRCAAMFTYEPASDGDSMASARFFGFTTESAKTVQDKKIEETILEIVKRQPGINFVTLTTATKDQLAAEGFTGRGYGRDAIRGAVQRLINANRIRVRSGEKTGAREEAKHYAA